MLQTLTGHLEAVMAVAMSSDGQTLASGSRDATVKLWRVSDGQLLHTFTGHTGAVRSVAFWPGGDGLASGSEDQTIRAWRVSTRELVVMYDQEIGPSTEIPLHFSPDMQLLTYGRDDATMVLAFSPFQPPPCYPCDTDCDGNINAFDIEPFIGILFNGDPPCNTCAGDANGDGVVNAFDIEPFLDCLFP